MKKISIIYSLFFFCFLTNGYSQIDANLTFNNYIKTDMTVYVECYDKKGNLKVNESFIVPKSTGGKDSTTATSKLFTTKGYKGGNIKIKYHPTESTSKFTWDPIPVPDANNTLNQSIPLTGLELYDLNDNKSRLLAVGTNLKFDSTTTFDRLPDIKAQLGSLVIGKMTGKHLDIIEVIPLKQLDIPYDKPSVLQESAITEKSVVSKLKISIPIYGSVESSLSNSGLHQIKWDISYYPFKSNVGFSGLITELDKAHKTALISDLKLNDPNLNIFLLRSFDVIESGIFSVTSGTKINTEGSAALASVFTANAAYAFKSEDSKFVSIPNKAYNLKYEKWQTVGDLITKLGDAVAIPPDGKNAPTLLIPLMVSK